MEEGGQTYQSRIVRIDKDVEELQLLFITGGHIKWHSQFRKQFGSSSKY